MILTNAPLTAVLPATDIERAKVFWTNKIGLTVSSTFSDGSVMFKAGEGTMLMVYQRPVPTKAEHTVAGFKVSNLDEVMKELKDKGVVFEEYDMPGLKTVNGVAEMENMKAAWFKDPEGNIVAINEM